MADDLTGWLTERDQRHDPVTGQPTTDPTIGPPATALNETRTPDQAASDHAIGVAVGQPPEAVQAYRDMFSRAADAANVQEQTASTPRLQQWLAQPHNYAVARDDAHNLSVFEQIGASLQNANPAAAIGGDIARWQMRGFPTAGITPPADYAQRFRNRLNSGTVVGRPGGMLPGVWNAVTGFVRDLPIRQRGEAQNEQSALGYRNMLAVQGHGPSLSEAEQARLTELNNDPNLSTIDDAPPIIGASLLVEPQLEGGISRAFQETGRRFSETEHQIYGSDAAQRATARRILNGDAGEAGRAGLAGVIGAIPLALSAGGGAAGGYSSFNYEMEAGQAFEQYKQAGLEPLAAANAAEQYATAATAIEMASDYFELGLSGAGRVAGRVLGIGERIIPRASRRAIAAEFAGRLAATGGAEGLTEASQQAAQSIYQHLAQQRQAGESENLGEAMRMSPDEISQIIQSGWIGAQAGVGLGGIPAGVNLGLDLRAHGQAVAASQRFEAQTKAAQASLLNERGLPDVLESAVAHVDPSNVYIDADKFVEHFQSAGANAYAVADELGIGSQNLASAVAAHGRVEIPTSTFAARVLRVPQHQALQEHAAIAPDAQTPAEAKVATEQVRADIDRMVEETKGVQSDNEFGQAIEGHMQRILANAEGEGGPRAEVSGRFAKLAAALPQAMVARARQTDPVYADRLEGKFRAMFGENFDVAGPTREVAAGGASLSQAGQRHYALLESILEERRKLSTPGLRSTPPEQIPEVGTREYAEATINAREAQAKGERLTPVQRALLQWEKDNPIPDGLFQGAAARAIAPQDESATHPTALELGSPQDVAQALDMANNPKIKPEDLFGSALMRAVEKHVNETPDTATAQQLADPEFLASREYVDPETGEKLNLDQAVNRLTELYESKAGPKGPATERQATIVMGYPGAGKSTFADHLALTNRAAILDADVAKGLIPAYEDGFNTQAVHRESAALRIEARDEILAKGENVLMERIGEDPAELIATLESLKAKGYEVSLVHVKVDPDEAVRRSVRRFIETGRYIEPQTYRRILGKVVGSFEQAIADPRWKGYVEVDANGPKGTATEIRQGGENGKELSRSALGGQTSEQRRQGDRSGSAGTKGEGELNQFAGENAATANKDNLKLARALEREGKDEWFIWHNTGWGRGTDGKWRFEIPDHGKTFAIAWNSLRRRKSDTPLAEAFAHRQLFEAYPQLRDVKVRMVHEKGVGGTWSPSEGVIEINPKADVRTARQTMLHEIQHAIQDIEGFAPGTDWRTLTNRRAMKAAHDELTQRFNGYTWLSEATRKKWISEIDARVEAYRTAAGEAEARATENRTQDETAIPPGEATRNEALSPELLWNPRRKRWEHFNQTDARGSIVFKNFKPGEFGSVLIKLGQASDLSTFLHEFGHFGHLVLESIATDPQAPAEFKSMWANTLSWWGVDQTRWDAMSDAERTPYYETWARTFEAYLMEGKAPSFGLREAFAAFKEWLKQIYRTLRLDHNLNPQIRDVFDRMLASDDEVAQARAEMGADFSLSRKAFKTDQEFQQYRQAIQDAKDAQEAELRARAMDAYVRKSKRWWRNERERTRPAARRFVDSDPARRAHDWIAFDDWRALPDTSLSDEGETSYVAPADSMEEMPEGLPPMKLSAEALASDWPNANLPVGLNPRIDPETVLTEAMSLKAVDKGRGVKRPARLWRFIKDNGGIQDPDGSIRSSMGGGRARPGVINQNGKSAEEMLALATEAGYFGDGAARELNQFAGPRAVTADLGALDRAKAMTAQGATPEEIHKATGWFKRPDGWRFEIDDSKTSLNELQIRGGSNKDDAKGTARLYLDRAFGSVDGAIQQIRESYGFTNAKEKAKYDQAIALLRAGKVSAQTGLRADTFLGKHRGYVFGGKLGDLLNAPDLFAAYPQLRTVEVHIGQSGFMTSGSFDPASRVLTADGSGTKEEILHTVVHEIQHAIQTEEGFQSGGNSTSLGGRTQAALFEVTHQIALLPPGSNTRAELESIRDKLREQSRNLSGGTAGFASTPRETDAYKRLLGEVEARNAETRLRMNPKERAASFPLTTEDVPANEQYDPRSGTPLLTHANDTLINEVVAQEFPKLDVRIEKSPGSDREWAPGFAMNLPHHKGNIGESIHATPQEIAENIKLYGTKVLAHAMSVAQMRANVSAQETRAFRTEHPDSPRDLEGQAAEAEYKALLAKQMAEMFERIGAEHPELQSEQGYEISEADPNKLIEPFSGRQFTPADLRELNRRMGIAIGKLKGVSRSEREAARYDFDAQGMDESHGIQNWHPEAFAALKEQFPDLVRDYQDADAYVRFTYNKANAGLSASQNLTGKGGNDGGRYSGGHLAEVDSVPAAEAHLEKMRRIGSAYDVRLAENRLAELQQSPTFEHSDLWHGSHMWEIHNYNGHPASDPLDAHRFADQVAMFEPSNVRPQTSPNAGPTLAPRTTVDVPAKSGKGTYGGAFTMVRNPSEADVARLWRESERNGAGDDAILRYVRDDAGNIYVGDGFQVDHARLSDAAEIPRPSQTTADTSLRQSGIIRRTEQGFVFAPIGDEVGARQPIRDLLRPGGQHSTGRDGELKQSLIYHGSAAPLKGIRPILFATPDQDIAAFFARLDRKETRGVRRLTPLEHHFDNPMEVEANGALITAMGTDKELQSLIEKAQANGNDAIIVHNVIDGPAMDMRSIYAKPTDIYIILDPSKVKKLPADYIDASGPVRRMLGMFGSHQLFQGGGDVADQIRERVRDAPNDVPRNVWRSRDMQVAYPKSDPSTRVSARPATEDGQIQTSWATLNYKAGRDMIVGEEQGDARPVRKDIFDLTYQEVAPGQFAKRSDVPVGYWIADRPQTIHTLEGDVEAQVGDYVMVGAVGEMWPIKPAKFAERYDVAEQAAPAAPRAPDHNEFISALISDLNNERQVYSSKDGGAHASAQNLEDARNWFDANNIDLSKDKEEIRGQIVAALEKAKAEPGLHPDDVAPWFGFSSGDELIQALSNLKPRAQAIEDAIDGMLGDQYGDAMSPDRIKAEAEKAAHAEAQSRAIELELSALQEATGGRKTPVGNAARAYAKQRVDAMSVAQVRRADMFLAGERRAARNAMELTEKGGPKNLAEAARQKQKQLISFWLFRFAQDTAAEMDRAQNYFGKFDREGVRAKIHAPVRDQIDQLLERIDLRRNPHPSQGQRADYQEWYDSMRAEGLSSMVIADPTNIEALLGIKVKDPRVMSQPTFASLDISEVRGLKDVVMNLEFVGKKWREMLEAQRRQKLDEAVADMTASMAEVKPIQYSNVRNYSPGALERADVARQQAHAVFSRVEFVARAMDRNQDNGPVWNGLFRRITESRASENERLIAEHEATAALFDVYSAKERADMWTVRRFYPQLRNPRPEANGEMGVNLTKQEVLSMAMNVGTEYNFGALAQGGNWADNELWTFLDSAMDARDWRFVQSTWNYVNKFWPEIQALYLKSTGVAPPKVEARPFTTRFGEMQGGYYPLKYDFGRDQRARDEIEYNEVQEAFGGPSLARYTPNGFTKARVGSGGRPVLLDLSVLTQHVSSVIHDLEFRLPVIDTWRLIKHPDFQQAFVRSAGLPQYNALKPWLQWVATNRLPPENYVSGSLKLLRRNTPVALVGAVGTWVQQPAGILSAMHRLGTARVMAKLIETLPPWQWVDHARFVNSKSQFMRSYASGHQRDLRELVMETNSQAHVDIVNLFLTGNMRQKLRAWDQITANVGKWSLYPNGYINKWSASIPWRVAYERAVGGRVKNIDPYNEADAIAYADQLVRTTFGSGQPEDLAPIMRAGEAGKLITPAFSFVNTQYNQMYNEQVPGLMRGHVSIPEFFTFFLMALVAQQIISDWARGALPHDDDDDQDQMILDEAANSATLPVNGIPIINDISRSVARKLILGEQIRGDSIPAFAAVTNSATAISGITSDIGAGEPIDRSTARATVMAGGYWLGYPSRQAWITGSYLSDWASGTEDPTQAEPADTFRESLLRDTR